MTYRNEQYFPKLSLLTNTSFSETRACYRAYKRLRCILYSFVNHFIDNLNSRLTLDLYAWLHFCFLSFLFVNQLIFLFFLLSDYNYLFTTNSNEFNRRDHAIGIQFPSNQPIKRSQLTVFLALSFLFCDTV